MAEPKTEKHRRKAVHVGPPPTTNSLSHNLVNHWRLDLGATATSQGTLFRVWAPKRESVDVVIITSQEFRFPLQKEGNGYFVGFHPKATSGTRYRYALDEDLAVSDPCSRYQPDGPHGDSVVIDPNEFHWTDHKWKGSQIKGQIIYEMHIGTFTREGTFEAARREIQELKRIGITTIEIMPVNECAGRWNWGYDGVNLYAPYHIYGHPNDLKNFVNTAHQAGMGVILDVVYNHLGPDGNYLESFSDTYFTDRYKTDWGKSINFDGDESIPVREFFIKNACYWVSEFHFDGLRLDATQNIYDSSALHVLSEISNQTRAAAGERSIILMAENEPQDIHCIMPVDKGGYGLDAIWNDDFHHSIRVALTQFREAYLTDYRGRPQELISLIRRGFLYQGQYYDWQHQPRGTPTTTEPSSAFVVFIQNHDQVSNHCNGERLSTTSNLAVYRALSALMLFSPETPLLFMGQEFNASSPFLFFTDHNPTLAPLIREGRKKFLSQFPTYVRKEIIDQLPDPNSEQTFLRSKIDLNERQTHKAAYLFHQDLIRLRKNDPVIAMQDWNAIDGAVLGPETFLLRYFGDTLGDRLLVVNLRPETKYYPCPEPLLAPPHQSTWKKIWSSDDVQYGGSGKDVRTHPHWHFPEPASLLFTSEKTNPPPLRVFP